MIPFSDQRRLAKARLASVLLVLAVAGGAVAASAAAADSTYPAGASRPLTPAQAAASAHQARASRPKPARKKTRKPALHGNPARALLAFQAMQKYYYLQGSGLYSGEP